MTVLLGNSVRDALPIDLMRRNVGEDAIEAALKGLFPDDQVRGAFAPADQLAEFIYGLAQTAQGRAFLDWILDCTLRAPYTVTGATIEQTALNAARREGINIPAEMILAAINRGEKSVAARASGARQ